MSRRKVVIHGADLYGEKLAKRIDHIFDVIGFIDRKADMEGTEKSGVRVWRDIDDMPEKADLILCAVPDFNGQQREYVKRGIPFESILDFRHPHQPEKHILHQCLKIMQSHKYFVGRKPAPSECRHGKDTNCRI